MSQFLRPSRIVSDRHSEDRADELFRESVGAFAALTRPSGRQVEQLEALALALYERTGMEVRRYAAAVLSDNARAPRGLLLRLAHEPIAVSAPLLSRTTSFSTRDWLHLIKNTGIDHSRVIARRSDLPTTIRVVLSHLQRREDGIAATPKEAETGRGAKMAAQSPRTLREVQLQLRAMMAGNGAGRIQPSQPAAGAELPSLLRARLQPTALSGDVELFVTALADALGLSYTVADHIVRAEGTHHLVLALRALGISPAEAHLLIRAIRPDTLGTTTSIRLFIERFEALSADQAQDRLDDWRRQSAAAGQSAHQAAEPVEEAVAKAADRAPVDFKALSAENDALPRLCAAG